MMPIRSMDSYPYQRNQMPFPQYYHPGIEALPPQMKVDPSKPHLSYDPRWPYAANYGHLIPPHFCCGHNNFPCHYGYMPSYPHAPSPMYYSGGCPAYTDPYFLPYSPQPHQTMELPRYDYDKHMPRDHHCCGCPNHSCNQKEGTSVKIEEHEPDVGRKVNDSLVPIQLKNYPYPFVWIPQEHTSNKQLNNPNTMEVGEKNKPPSVENANAVAQPAQEPRVWNGWLPFDIKGVPSTIHDGFEIRNQKQDSGNNRGESENGEMDQKRQSEPKRSEFPFPIFWLPYYNKLEESGETNNQEKNNSSPKIVEEVPHVVKSVPVKSHVDEGGMNRTRSDQAARPDTNASDVAEKVSNARSIPVKQIGKDASLDQMEENVAKKDSSTDDKRGQSASLPKASKLPPVCLRVDPLPRKKNGNGSSRSRSLSPPSSKGQAQVTSVETLKTPVSGTIDKTQQNLNHQNAPRTTEKVEPKEKTIQEYECKTNENKGVDKTDECQSQINVNIPSEGSKRTKDTCTDSDECKIEDKEAGKGAENMEETTQLGEVKDSSTLTDVGSKEGKILSDADAAVLIQAAYRGYQVRKWEPLKKLKQIDEVRKEVTNVQDRVQAFERSSDLQNDEKQKIAIGENIMRLLLKLDTIQGLHPNLREIRKSLARVLTMLQERLDSLMANKPQQQMQAIQKDVEVTPTNMQNEETLALPGDSSEGNSDGGNVSQSPVDPVPNEGGESVKNGSWSEDTIQVVTADTLNSTSDLSETDKMAVESEDKSEPKDILIEVDELDMTVVKELPVGVLDEDRNDASIEKEEEHDNTGSGSVSAMVNDSARDGLGSENHAMMELPVELLDEDERDNEMNISKETQTKNGEFIEELPVGLLDEKAEESEEEKHDEAKPKEVLMAQETECNADEETSSSTDDTSKEAQSEQQQQPLEAQKEDIELPPLTTNANDHEAGNEDVCLEANDANNISVEPTEFVTIEDTQKEEEPEEKIALKETQKDGEEKVAETLAEEKAVSAALQADHDGGLNGESKLVEENEKLREMMKKLLEAGNEQLSVISDLSGRVKELEKRLARSRNKRMKTKRYRSAASKISGMSS
ncbi:BAG family molecular chaperone regulator [Vigna angularis]|uniref:BAG family molecular chaperone regulator n=1 Tax=Phaseolus angularis TaxID=3914 RepID=A0A8T0JPX5_PHAAN|nr:BAG family molecular chaperone regulator 6 [Vigna angularis]KAG2380262.1 BAG family molecular chaperone regulator [Vigna angularis]